MAENKLENKFNIKSKQLRIRIRNQNRQRPTWKRLENITSKTNNFIMEQTKHVKSKSKYGPKTNIKSIKKLNRQH